MKQAVLIMVDTQRQDMLSCYDADAAPTPVLDALAREGMQFTNGYTCQPVCGPARSAIFTGLYPHSNGMIANSAQTPKRLGNGSARMGLNAAISASGISTEVIISATGDAPRATIRRIGTICAISSTS